MCGLTPCQSWALPASSAFPLRQAGFQDLVGSLPVGEGLLWDVRFVKKNAGLKTWLLVFALYKQIKFDHVIFPCICLSIILSDK